MNADEPTKIRDLLEQFEAVTGEHIICSDDTQILLWSSETGILSDLEVPPDEVYTVVETILIANRFVLTDMKRGEPRMLTVSSLDSPARSNVRGDARFVAPEQLGMYADHPAFLIQTVLHLPNLDVRTMGNSMRAMVVDPNTMQLVPIPEARSIILIGFGSVIHQMAEMMMVLDGNEAKTRAKAEAEAEAKALREAKAKSESKAKED